MARERGGIGLVYRRGLAATIRNNASAYGYSIQITMSLAIITVLDGEPAAGDIFLFMAGAIAATVLLEAIASDFFRHRLRGEPSEVVVVGSALSFLSNGLGLGAASIAALLLAGWLAWFVGGFVSIAAYLGAAAIEMALADLLVQDAKD